MLSRLAYSTVSMLLSMLPVPALLNDSKSILTWGVLFFLSVLFFVFYSLQEYSMPDYNFESTKIVEAWILSQCFPGGGCAVWICAGFSFHSWALLFGLESEGRIFWKFHSGLLNSLAERGHWAFVEKLCVWANLDSEHSFGVSCKKELQSEHQTHQLPWSAAMSCVQPALSLPLLLLAGTLSFFWMSASNCFLAAPSLSKEKCVYFMAGRGSCLQSPKYVSLCCLADVDWAGWRKKVSVSLGI